MHHTAKISGAAFLEVYGSLKTDNDILFDVWLRKLVGDTILSTEVIAIMRKAYDVFYNKTSIKIVVDIGGQDLNGSLRHFAKDMRFVCVDIVEHPSVDVVVKPGDKLPFEDGSVHLVVSTSCFEHDPCFWMTFKEMTRIVALDGFIYINVPSSGIYHNYPGDNWRFYSDAGQALAFWSGKQLYNEEVYPVKVVETFHVLPQNDIWTDLVCVWQRTLEKETEIVISQEITNTIGVLETALRGQGLKTIKKCFTTVDEIRYKDP